MPILNESELDWLCENVPDAPRSPKGGRPPADKRLMLKAIFWVLDNGAKWKSLPAKLGCKSTAHRWFLSWAKAGVFEELMNLAGLCIEEKGGFKLYECFIDGTFSKAKGGGDGIGATKVGKGVKLMIMVDAKGLPVAACTSAAGPHESRSVQELFDFMITTQKPERLIGNKAYDSDALDEAMAAMQVEMIAPHRRNRRAENATQDARPLRRYRRRWKVERTIAWLQHFRRLCIRWEKSSLLFQGFVHFACTMLLLREVLG